MQRVLITGAAKRLGKVLAEGLAGAGCQIAVHYSQSEAQARALVERLQAQGVKAQALRADLSDIAAARRLPDQAAKALGGPLTGLVNNASRFVFDDPQNIVPDVLHDALRVNLEAPLALSQAFYGQAAEGTDNAIVNLLDQKLWNLNPDFFSYSVSKYALLGATRMMAMSYAPKVRVNAIAPGLLFPSLDQTADEFADTANRNLMQRPIEPAEIVRALMFLLDSPGITGQVLHVDNGQRFLARDHDVMFATRTGSPDR